MRGVTIMLTCTICRHLVRPKSLRQTCKNSPLLNTSTRFFSIGVPKLVTENCDLRLPYKVVCNSQANEISLACKLINEYQEPECVEWEIVFKKLKDLKLTNPRSAIFQSFKHSSRVDYAATFFRYLIREGQQFTILELMTILHIFSLKKELILKNKDIIQYVYENIKDYLLLNHAVETFIIDVLAEVPDCFNDLVKAASKVRTGCKGIVAVKALNLGRTDLAVAALNGYSNSLPSKFTESYLDYLAAMAKHDQLQPDLITSMVKFYEEKLFALDSEDLYSAFLKIVNTANKNNSTYVWSVHKCEVTDDVCSICKNALIHKKVSETEFNILKKDLFSQIALLYKNIFISTSDAELQKFFSFLKNCKPYDMVLDSLNIIYRKKMDGISNIVRVSRYLLEEGHSILVIGRDHVKKKITDAISRKGVNSKAQFFFPSNMSDDDVFVLYATVCGGPEVYFVSSDQYSSYIARVSCEQRDIFLKWKIYHQYIFNGIDLIPPRRHLGVPQITCSPNKKGKKFIWHISSTPSSLKLNSITPIKWICLEAQKRENRSS